MINHSKIVVIGCSAGGLRALLILLKPLSVNFPYAIIIVQHLARGDEALLIDVLSSSITLPVHEAIAEEEPLPGNVYIASGDYHLLLEKDGTFNLSLDEKILGSRPAIDILFETAIETFGKKVITILLTGNSSDGANGIAIANKAQATIFIQNPDSALYPVMPKAAATKTGGKYIYELEDIGQKLKEMDQQ